MDSYVYFLILPYICWSAAYCFCSILTPKKFLKYPMGTILLLYFIFVPITMVLKTRSVLLGTISIQILFISVIFFFFQEKFLKKLACYFIFAITVTVVELVSANLLVLIRHLWSASSLNSTLMYRLSDLPDVICISILDTVIGIFWVRKEVALLKRCFSYLNTRTFLQLLFPVFFPIFGQAMLLHQTESVFFPFLVVLYWSFCVFSYPLFYIGLQNIQAQERIANKKRQQLQLMKDQLSFSQELEKGYQALRKWNHDVENHLLSLSYLMDMKKYKEAGSYCCSMALSPAVNTSTGNSGSDTHSDSLTHTDSFIQEETDAASEPQLRTDIDTDAETEITVQNKCKAILKKYLAKREQKRTVPRKRPLLQLSYNKYLFFISMACMQFVWFLDVFSFFFQKAFQSLILLGFFSMVILIQMYILIMKVLDSVHTDMEIAAVKKQAELREEHSAMLSERRKESLNIQQNMQNRIEMFQSLLASGNYDEADAYLKETISKFQQERYHPCCQDNLLNAILDGKKRLAAKEHIRTDYKILLPENCPIPAADLSSIIFNLLDNGIEACLHSASPDPFIRLSLYKNKEFLTFHMENSKNPDTPFSHNTTKDDTQNHGLGLSIIEEICGKYDGTYQWQDLGYTFDSVVLLRINES